MTYRFLAMIILTALAVFPAGAQTPSAAAKPAPAKGNGYNPPRTPDGQPDLQGVWDIGTMTPLERPAALAGKEFFTPEEAVAYEKDRKQNRDKRGASNEADLAGAYNDVWYPSGLKVVRTLRTSMITDPPDGKLPALTPDAQKRQDDRRKRQQRVAEDVTDRSLSERCLMFRTDTLPMTPWGYNDAYRISQTKDYVAINIEMVHDVRIIPLDGRPHLPSNVRSWFGDSRGHWEGNTLVVDTTNFNDTATFNGSDRNLHVIERFTRTDANTILYQWSVDDPTAFTKPFKGEFTFASSPGPIYEYACHEGNYAIKGILEGARAQEKAEAAAKSGSK